MNPSRIRVCMIGLALAATLLAGPAQALTVTRCGNTYTDVPCEGGQELEASDSRTARQAQEQLAITERTQRAADKLEAQRHTREAEEQAARIRAQQELRHQLEFEARMRKLEQPTVVTQPAVRVGVPATGTGGATGTLPLPPLQRPPMFRVPRPTKPSTAASAAPGSSAPAVPPQRLSVADEPRRVQD